jgi:hypothetical protein
VAEKGAEREEKKGTLNFRPPRQLPSCLCGSPSLTCRAGTPCPQGHTPGKETQDRQTFLT